MKKLKNLLFDFGGVILNIDFAKTINAFQKIGIQDFDKVFSKFKQDTFMQDFERGIHAPQAFYDYIRGIANLNLANDEIETAWNALLLDYPTERLALLQELSKNYKLYLLSNTNEVHYNRFQADFTSQFGYEFDSHFHTAYYSHLLGERKPDDASFLKVCSFENIQPEETLFIDDTEINTIAASNLGFQTLHIKDEEEITTALPALLAKLD